jgi:hypothetical protein
MRTASPWVWNGLRPRRRGGRNWRDADKLWRVNVLMRQPWCGPFATCWCGSFRQLEPRICSTAKLLGLSRRTRHISAVSMTDFLCKVWALVRAYRLRLLLGVVAGVISGLLEPLMIAIGTFVYGVIFPSANAPDLTMRLKWDPEFLRDLAQGAQDTLHSGVQSHPGAIIALIAAVTAVIFLRGFFSYLNVYCLQWAAIRAITDLRIRLFESIIHLPAGFFSRANTGELMSRIMNDTGALPNIVSYQAVEKVLFERNNMRKPQ